MKIRTIGIKMALALSAMLMAGCNDDLDGYGKSVGDLSSSEAIVFATSGGVGASAEPVTRHAGYVDEMVEEWELTGEQQSDTRAAIRTSLYAQFNPAATQIYMYDDWNDNTKPYYMIPSEAQIGAGVMTLPGRFDEQGILTPLNPTTMEDFTILWSETKQRYVAAGGSSSGNFAHFRAYGMAPLTDIQKLGHDAGGDWSPTSGPHMRFNTGGKNGTTFKVPSIDYRVPEEPEDQLDIIAAATGEMDMGDVYGKRVPLSFFHTLAAVQFKVGFECRVVALTIDGVYKSGHCELIASGEEEWTSLAGNYSHTFSFNDGTGTDYAEGAVLTEGDQTLMLIPQTIPDGATITLTYQPTGGGTTQTIVCDISGFQWMAGHRYIYTIKEEPSYSIFFDLAAGNVTCNGSTYTGYVYVDGVVQEVSGTHVASNKYYVYQSTGNDTSLSTRYDKDHTGYTATQFNTTEHKANPGAYPVIPDYPEIKVGGKTWQEFITGNFDRNTVRTTFDTKAAECYRISTNNYMNFQVGNEDVTIDNLYTTTLRTTTPGVDGKWPMQCVGSVKLKGDSRLVSLRLTGETLTSYYGDGSTKGTVTLMHFNDTGLNDNTLYLVSHSDGGGFHTWSIKGGTIYAATRTKYVDSQEGGLGGACVLCLHGQTLNIEGGVLTAMAWGNMAAIGGEATSTGVIAATPCSLNFSGGKVYAYAGGVYQPKNKFLSGFVVCNTAIGGGSSITRSAGNAVINIYDNAYIEATSVGGTAIGGGASGTARGGKGTVNIYGNSKVIAKSISGTIVSSNAGYDAISVEAGTSIGGGSGGKRNSDTDAGGRVPAIENIGHGGDAEVSVYGNTTLIAGSVGGGSRGVLANNEPALLGNATVNIYENCDVQMQAVMADTGGSSQPSFTMSGGNLQLKDDSFAFSQSDGGAVWMDSGICTITGGTIDGFTAQNGGAVYMEGGTFSMSGGTIQNCRAKYNSSTGAGGNGGAVYINDTSGSAMVNINGGTITGNYADRNGGAIYLEGGNVSITGGYVQTCKALGLEVISTAADNKGNGGGIYLMKGNYTQTGGYVQGNFAKRNGGGIYVSSPSASGNNIAVNIRDGEIRDNNCDRYGAGLYVMPQGANQANVYLGTSGQSSYTSPRITGNSASLNGGGIYVARPVDHYDAGKPVYVTGSEANLYVYEGNIGGKIWKEMYKNNNNDNFVSAYVYNQDITNEGGLVALALGGDGKPVADVDYITVTIDPNGGDFASGNTAADPIYRYLVTSSNSTLSLPTPKRKNFTFLGWQPSYGVVTTGYSDSQYVDGMIFNFYKDITLTAQWRSNF